MSGNSHWGAYSQPTSTFIVKGARTKEEDIALPKGESDGAGESTGAVSWLGSKAFMSASRRVNKSYSS